MLMTFLPQLPVNPTHLHGRWSDNVHAAYDQILSICTYAIPLLVALEGSDEARELSSNWFRECAMHIAELSNDLANAQETTCTTPVTEERTGKPGRPRKHINVDFMREAVDAKRRITLVDLAS
ncbi:hypothetical protein GG344DRAFT_83256 [Lentinula edodes]|nr:hypothetical protein GG344DRAFT_83256 [Lentinula edodes]